MIAILSLEHQGAVSTLTYDGLGLRLEGQVLIHSSKVAPFSSHFWLTVVLFVLASPTQRQRTDISILPLYKIHLLSVRYEENAVRVSSLLPWQQGVADSPLELYDFEFPVHRAKEPEAIQFCSQVMADIYDGNFYDCPICCMSK